MSTARKEPIAKVDTAWLRMEQPTNLMMITGVIVLHQPVEFQHFRDIIANRFLAFPRFRQKAVDTVRGCWWEEDVNFELSSHVRRTALPGEAGKAELEELVSELASTPLDKTKPLWQFHLVENYVDGPVVITRIHHCYADGIALVQVLLSLTEDSAEKSERLVVPEEWKKKRAAESNIFRRLMAPAREGMDAVQHVGQKVIDEAMHLIREPHLASDYALGAGEIMSELATALLLEDDPPSQFKGELGVRKNVAWADPVSLEEVKAVGKALGCTVNDVLIATMTGALHQYLVEQGDDPSELTMRATVPVNLRPLEHARDLGNHFGLVFLDLPIAESNPLARLYQVAEFMHQLKSSKQAVMSLGLLAALGMAPTAVQKPALELFSRKASTVLTNVPGPQQPLYLAGAPIGEMMFWVPQSGSIGMGISIISYNGQVFCGLISDKKRVPDPSSVMRHFELEFENLLHLTMLLGPQEGWVSPDMADSVHAWIDGDHSSEDEA
ncbi:WS/DGAT/MGAT family O-acyltransferase [Wenzhouxiangella marina]|uniref:WS/DGAT/MGAT family O-acyltransferase n=1 Tax=Wenzhouxiangella marina TaxID=1579979 RepID=UPI0017B70721|nr:wax ester/triacylglycerol synthase family O-acyltransferase [Wenzhouxiangella marina]MBB6086062.1 WS/DGAT/MGAT family acyltransferase [Wenzhouxiangella marina]